MRDQPELALFDDKGVFVPDGLIHAGLDGEVVAMYAVMKSCKGSASLGEYGSLLNWGRDKVRRWQKVLEVEGWMRLVREGHDQEPRVWWMCLKAFEDVPTAVTDLYGQTLPLLLSNQGPENQEAENQEAGFQHADIPPPYPLINRGVNKSVSKGGRKVSRPPWASADGHGWAEFLEVAQAEVNRLRAVRGMKALAIADMVQGPEGRAVRHRVITLGTTFNDWKSHLANLGRHPFSNKKAWSLKWFCDNFREFEHGAAGLTERDGGGSRGFGQQAPGGRAERRPDSGGAGATLRGQTSFGKPPAENGGGAGTAGA